MSIVLSDFGFFYYPQSDDIKDKDCKAIIFKILFKKKHKSWEDGIESALQQLKSWDGELQYYSNLYKTTKNIYKTLDSINLLQLSDLIILSDEKKEIFKKKINIHFIYQKENINSNVKRYQIKNGNILIQKNGNYLQNISSLQIIFQIDPLKRRLAAFNIAHYLEHILLSYYDIVPLVYINGSTTILGQIYFNLIFHDEYIPLIIEQTKHILENPIDMDCIDQNEFMRISMETADVNIKTKTSFDQQFKFNTLIQQNQEQELEKILNDIFHNYYELQFICLQTTQDITTELPTKIKPLKEYQGNVEKYQKDNKFNEDMKLKIKEYHNNVKLLKFLQNNDIIFCLYDQKIYYYDPYETEYVYDDIEVQNSRFINFENLPIKITQETLNLLQNDIKIERKKILL